MSVGNPKPPKFKTEEEKYREALRLLPIIEPLLPEYGEFHLPMLIWDMKLNEEDKNNAREVSLQIIQLLLQNGTHKISRPNNSHQHIEKIIFNHIPNSPKKVYRGMTLEEINILKEKVFQLLKSRVRPMADKIIVSELGITKEVLDVTVEALVYDKSVLKEPYGDGGRAYFITLAPK